jgi:hypothetical protein
MTTGIVESGRPEAAGRGARLGIATEVGSGAAVGIGTRLGIGATSGGTVIAGRGTGEAIAGRVGSGASDGMSVGAGSGVLSEPVQATDAVSAMTSSARTPNSPPGERASNGPADRVAA